MDQTHNVFIGKIIHMHRADAVVPFRIKKKNANRPPPSCSVTRVCTPTLFPGYLNNASPTSINKKGQLHKGSLLFRESCAGIQPAAFGQVEASNPREDSRGDSRCLQIYSKHLWCQTHSLWRLYACVHPLFLLLLPRPSPLPCPCPKLCARGDYENFKRDRRKHQLSSLDKKKNAKF